MAESYVRPPLVAREAPSRRLAALRFWLVFAIVLAAIIVGVYVLYRLATGGGEGSPGLQHGLRATVLVVGATD